MRITGVALETFSIVLHLPGINKTSGGREYLDFLRMSHQMDS